MEKKRLVNIELFSGLAHVDDEDENLVDCAFDVKMADWWHILDANFEVEAELSSNDFVYDFVFIEDDTNTDTEGKHNEVVKDRWSFANGKFNVELYAANEEDGKAKLEKFLKDYCK